MIQAGPDPAPLERDAYDDLLRHTRGLRGEQARARDAWLARLSVEGKVDRLFELEVLLKGLGCFANPRNHAGPPRRGAIVALDFREHAVVVREALARIVDDCRLLHAQGESAFLFHRYLETLLPDDGVRARLDDETLTQDTPERSLWVLRHAMSNLYEVTSGLTRASRVPFRQLYSLLALAQREIGQSLYFNPLHALEFRPEFDRITHVELLDLVRAVPGDAARQLVALTVLSLFRMLRYVALVEGCVRNGGGDPQRAVAMVYVVLSVLRSDARALTAHLRRRAGPSLAEAFDADVYRVHASQLSSEYERLLARGHGLRDIKATLEGVAANLRLEIRRAFRRDFPPIDSAPSLETVGYAVDDMAGGLRPALQNAVMFLARSLGTGLDERVVFNDVAARRLLSERLRADVWMFAQIVRAFAGKARATGSLDAEAWTGASPLGFVREFLAYFRAMGLPLLRAADYPRVSAFVATLDSLRDADMLDPARLHRAIEEAEQFYVFLTDLFDAISRREDIAELPFDRRAAAESLKLYLGG